MKDKCGDVCVDNRCGKKSKYILAMVDGGGNVGVCEKHYWKPGKGYKIFVDRIRELMPE